LENWSVKYLQFLISFRFCHSFQILGLTHFSGSHPEGSPTIVSVRSICNRGASGIPGTMAILIPFRMNQIRLLLNFGM
jgi:hypothetical protein